jgi:hypothetical protein
MHETSDKGRAFFLENVLFSIKAKEFDSLQNHLIKITDIRNQLKLHMFRLHKDNTTAYF